MPNSTVDSGLSERGPDESIRSNGGGIVDYGEDSTPYAPKRRVLVRRDRARWNPDHPNYFYNLHAKTAGYVGVVPSSTGYNPLNDFIVYGEESDTLPGAAGISDSFFTEGLTSDEESLVADPEKYDDNAAGNPQYAQSVARTVNSNYTKSDRRKALLKAPKHGSSCQDVWMAYCRCLTLLVTAPLLRWWGLTSKQQQSAWREKIGLVSSIAIITLGLGFFSFGLSSTICGSVQPRIHQSMLPGDGVVIHGRLFNLSTFAHAPSFTTPTPWGSSGFGNYPVDASFLFQNINGNCEKLIVPSDRSGVPRTAAKRVPWYFPCKLLSVTDGSILPTELHTEFPESAGLARLREYSPHACHTSPSARAAFYRMNSVSDVYYTWEDVRQSPRKLVVYMSDVIDLDRLKLLPSGDWVLDSQIEDLVNSVIRNEDISREFLRVKNSLAVAKCLVEIAKVGVIDAESVGYLASQIILYIFLTFIFSIVVIKFVFALYFEWFLSSQTSKSKFSVITCISKAILRYVCNETVDTNEEHVGAEGRHDIQGSLYPPFNSIDTSSAISGDPMFVVCLVTAYSESEEGLRLSLDSLAATEYPDHRKLMLIVCDGLVTGTGNEQMTSQIVLSMMDDRAVEPYLVPEVSYVSVGSGDKRVNFAQVHCGYYIFSGKEGKETHRVPMMCVIKLGLPDERMGRLSRAGNRGKRDSQIILMSFLQKLCTMEKRTDLENEMEYCLRRFLDINPIYFEAVLMVDADTVVYKDSLTHMVGTLCRDHQIIGICGETKIANKTESLVTWIQVFEYFISHHLTKSFESVFGGVTCLPGCFSMYRVKVSVESGRVLPLLASLDVVLRYSDNEVHTVHRRNLLLLGEDRYLTTLMLKTFPRRKLVFVPQAKCNTVVPSNFWVLMDQRRRWINSTIHNLLEIALVRELCGVSCCSMQFVVVIDLLGTITLPAAFIFTIYLLVACFYRPVPLVPLLLLAFILGIPAVLIVITAHKWTYVVWMVIYLLSLPVWNLILPLNAFWKFDDFSWGSTREVEDNPGIDRTVRKPSLKSDVTKLVKLKSFGEYLRSDRFSD